MAVKYSLPVKTEGRFILDVPSPRSEEVADGLLTNESSSSSEEDKSPSGLWGQVRTFLGRPVQRKTRNVQLLGWAKRVTVIAPGAGVGANGQVYLSLKHDPRFRLSVTGRSRMPYDRYPQSWPQGGSPAPNLETFSKDVVSQGLVEQTDCLVVGSRGGQVVLPNLWNIRGDAVPPAVVINGGCAMDLPIRFNWPSTAVTFLLLGGRDYFKPQHLNAHQYVADAQNRVPKTNSTTAILYVHEMEHMPAPSLLQGVLAEAISALTAWKASGCVPVTSFQTILSNLRKGGWNARLTYTCAAGAWQDLSGAVEASPMAATPSPLGTPLDNTPLGGSPFGLSPAAMAQRAMEQAPLPVTPAAPAVARAVQQQVKQGLAVATRPQQHSPVLLARQAEGAKQIVRGIQGGAVLLPARAVLRCAKR